MNTSSKGATLFIFILLVSFCAGKIIFHTANKYTCNSDEFYCKQDKECIPMEWKCDTVEDCWDATDEKDCHKAQCPSHMIQCRDSGNCIFSHWKCDGRKDCADGSDEIYCYNQ